MGCLALVHAGQGRAVCEEGRKKQLKGWSWVVRLTVPQGSCTVGQLFCASTDCLTRYAVCHQAPWHKAVSILSVLGPENVIPRGHPSIMKLCEPVTHELIASLLPECTCVPPPAPGVRIFGRTPLGA